MGPTPASTGVLNVMTIDVEDYFQVSAFEHVVAREHWHSFESRVCDNTDRLLDLLEATGTRATFFVLGWVAERYPGLLQRIRGGGHELASHGHAHRLVYSTSREEFREDLRRSKDAIEAAAGVEVVGYRAPSFSITQESLWALDILVEEGYRYDASIYPIRHDRYGIPDWPRHIHLVQRDAGAIWELPGSTVRFGGVNLPIGGGGYFRQMPYEWTRRGISRLNQAEEQPAVFYLHPWEVDPEQPRFDVPVLTGWRHYRNLHRTEGRLSQLLEDFRFGPVSEVLRQRQASVQPSVLTNVC